MAIYYVNASGSNTAPFETEEKGALNLSQLKAGVTLQSSDQVRVVATGGLITQNTVVHLVEGLLVYGWRGLPVIDLEQYGSIFLSGNNATLKGLELVSDGLVAGRHAINALGRTGITIDACFIKHLNGNANSNPIRFGAGIIKNTTITGEIRAGLIFLENSDNSEIFNNTLYNTYNGGDSYWLDIQASTQGLVIVNNIFSGDNVALRFRNFSSSGVASFSHNCVHGSSYPYSGATSVYNFPGEQGVSKDEQILEADPLLVNPSIDDLRIASGSPCVDAGAGTGTYSNIPSYDSTGHLRPVVQPPTNYDDGTDMGSYEYRDESMSILDTGNTIDVSGGDLPITSTFNKDQMIIHPKVALNSHFDSIEKWSLAIVSYKAPTGQIIRLLHRPRNGFNWEAQGLFKAESNLGVWQKNRVVIMDHQGDSIVFQRTEINPEEDITVTA